MELPNTISFILSTHCPNVPFSGASVSSGNLATTPVTDDDGDLIVSDLEDSSGESDDPWAFRSYEPTHPCSNRLLQKRWDAYARMSHCEKLRRTQPRIDTAPPKKYDHLYTQKKKEQMRVDTAAKIYTENNTLLERIKRQVLSAGLQRPADPLKAVIENPVVKKQGLNGPRKKELQERMEIENEVILQRLEEAAPFYKKKSLTKERINTLLHLQNISRYPKRYVRQLREAGIQFPRVPERNRPATARTDAVTTITRSELKSPQSWDYDRKIAIVSKSKGESAENESGFPVPPKYAPKAPLIPRVARLPPKQIITLEALNPPKPAKKVPLVPRCALIVPRRPVTAPVATPKAAKPSIYEEIPDNGQYKFEEEYPGDEELILTNDSWDKVTSYKAVVRLNSAGHVEEKRADMRYNFADQDNELSLINGMTGFGASFNFPNIVNYSFRVYVSSIDGDSDEERDMFIKLYLLPLRQYCASLGREFVWRDFKGNDGTVTDLHSFHKICVSELTTCQQESTGICAMVFFNNTHYGERGLPTDIDAPIFKMLLNQAKKIDFSHLMALTGGVCAEDLLKKWYAGDDNNVPKRYILRKAEEVIPTIESLDERNLAIRIWRHENLLPLKQIIRASAVRLGRKGLLEPFVVQRFVQSDFQEEIARGVIHQFKNGAWQRNVLCVNTEVLPKGEPVRASSEMLQATSEPDLEILKAEDQLTQDGKLLQKLVNPLLSSIPYENKILRSKRVEREENEDVVTAIVRATLDKLFERLKKIVSHTVMQQPFPNDVLLEVVTHNKVFKAKARDHSHRGHLIDKIMGYLKRSDAGAVPPFLIDGESCMGKTSVIGKALQKFVKLHTYKTWLKLQSNATKFSHDTIAPAVEYSDAFQSVENSDNVHIEPVIVARVCGLTPQSSNSRLLINSITRQILIAFGKPVDRDETLDVESYRLALSLARHDRPLFIVLAKADRLDQFNSVPLKLSWLLDLIPPHVKIIVSVQSNTSPTSVHEIISCRIRQMAPIVLYTNAAAEHRPPPSPGILASCAEDFFLNVGAIIAPIAKSTIKRMLALDNRKLRIDQEEALRGAFASVEVPDGNKYVPIRMLKEIYKISKNWKSSDQIGDVEFPISLQEALDLELDALELSHGYYFTMTFTCLLVFARDGLTIGELEDILSLDDYSLREALKFSPSNLARVPIYKVTKFLHDMEDYVLKRQTFGGEVITLSHDREMVACINNRYLGETENTDRITCLLFDYFNGTFSQEKQYVSMSGRQYLPSRDVLDMPWKFPDSDVCRKLYGQNSLFNVRKIREFPNACLLAGKLDYFESLLRDFNFLGGFVTMQSPDRAIEELLTFLHFDSTQWRPQQELMTRRPSLASPSNHTNVLNQKTSAMWEAQRFIEVVLDFLVWTRNFVDPAPPPLRKTIIFDMLFRLPDTSAMKSLLLNSVSRRDLSMTDWSTFELLEKNGYGILHCSPRFRPILTVSLRTHALLMRKSTVDQDGDYRTDIEIYTTPEWSLARKQCMHAGIEECTLDGESDSEPWQLPHSRSSMMLAHRRHSHSAASNDGKYIASGSSDGVVKVFDAMTGFLISSLNSIGRISAIEFHPTDSDMIVIALALSSNINKLIFWSLSKCIITHELSGKPLGFGVPLVACGILKEKEKKEHQHPQLRAYGLSLNGVLTLWDVVSKSILKQFAPDPEDDKILSTGTVAISRDGKYIAFGIRSMNFVSTHQLALLWTVRIHSAKSNMKNHVIQRIIFSQDSKHVYILSHNPKVNGYLDPKLEKGSMFQRFELASKLTSMLWKLDIKASDMAVAKDNSCVAFASSIGITQVISLTIGCMLACEPLSEPVTSILFVPELNCPQDQYMRKTDWTGNVVKESTCYRIAIGSHQLGINVIGFENGSTNKSFKYAISSAQLSPDGRFLALIGGGDHPEQAYDTSCFAQPSKESKLAEGTSLDDMPGLIQKTRLMQAAMSAPSKGAVAYNRRTSIEYAKGSARLNQSHRTGQGGEQSYFDEPPNASTLTIWDAETGTRIMRSLYSGKLVWCNFEMIGDVTTAFITADANGLIKLWNWNAIGTLKDDVFYRNMMFAGSNMKVETLCFSVAGFESSQIIGYSSQPQSGLLAVLMMEESKNIVQFWNLETGERFKSFDCVVTSAPYLNLTKSSLTMPLSWGIPADSLFRFCRLKKSIEKYTSRPACFVAGVDRFHISADFEPSKSESVRSTLEKLWGKEIYHEFTASCQSLHDESIMIVAKGAEMVWISEEMYPIRPISDANPAIDALKEESDVEPDVGPHKSNYRRESHRTSIGGRRESHRAIHGRGSLSVSALAEDTALELNNTTLDYCRIRRIKCDAGETIIALHHVKSYTVDCIVACTSNGTVLVYDIKIPSQYVSKMHAVKEIEEPAKLIGIWHARTPLSGMTVRMVCGAQNSEEYEETKLVRCRIALYGLNGFATVLNLQLK